MALAGYSYERWQLEPQTSHICYVLLQMLRLESSDIVNFWTWIEKSEPDDCWRWLGAMIKMVILSFILVLVNGIELIVLHVSYNTVMPAV